MNVCFKVEYFFKFIVTFAVCYFAAASTFAQVESQQMVVEGSLTDTSGNTINLANAPLTFYVSTTKGCYLFGESTTAAGDSDGNISHRIGSANLIAGSPNSYSKNIFSGLVSGTTTFAGNNCTASPGDARTVQVYYQALDMTATLKLGSVPFALQAQNALTLNGKTSTEFLPVTTDSNTLFNSGSAGQYLTRNASGLLMWITPPVTTNPGTATSSVTSITAGNGLSGGVITSAGTLSVNIGTTSGTVAAGNDSRINGALQAVNNLAEIAMPAMARANLGLGSLAVKTSIDLTADVSGFLPVANGGSPWQLSLAGPMTASNTTIGSNISYSNIGLSVFAPTSATNSLIGYFTNTNSDGNGVRINVDNTSSQKYGLKVSTNNSTITNFTVLNNGNVGIGTNSPQARFELPAGTMTTAAMKLNSGALLSSPASGSVEYDGSRLYITDDSNARRAIPTGSNVNTIDNITVMTSPNNLTLSATTVSTLGSFGVGTNFPSAKLHVFSGLAPELARFDSSNLGSYISFTRNGGGKAYIGYSSGAGTLFNNEIADSLGLRSEGTALQLGTGSTAHVTLLSNGRMGIGVASPTATLTVSGSIRTTAAIEFPDGTSQTTSAFGSYERIQMVCGSANTCQVNCNSGKKIIGGGCSQSGTAPLVSSNPASDTQWYCAFGTGTTANVNAFAICVKM